MSTQPFLYKWTSMDPTSMDLHGPPWTQLYGTCLLINKSSTTSHKRSMEWRSMEVHRGLWGSIEVDLYRVYRREKPRFIKIDIEVYGGRMIKCI
jgi:hypothetical protein